MDRLLIPDEACSTLRISKSQLYRLTSTKQIPFVKLRGRLRFRSQDLEQWVSSQAVDVESDKS